MTDRRSLKAISSKAFTDISCHAPAWEPGRLCMAHLFHPPTPLTWRAMPVPFGFAAIGFRGGRGVSTAPIRRVRPRRHRPMEGGIRPIAHSRDVTLLHRIPMVVIDRPVEIVLIADWMLPKPPLPNRPLPMLCLGRIPPFLSME